MAQSTFKCESCGKVHTWKAELAGRKARCKCGAVVAVPAAAPGDEPELDALYDLIPSEKDLKQDVPAAAVAAAGAVCPACSAAVVPGAVLCVGCGYNFKTGAQLQTAAASKAKSSGGKSSARNRGGGGAADRVGVAATTELLVPSAIALAGMGVGVWAIMQGTSAGLGIAMVAFMVVTLIQSIMIFVGCLLAVKMINISLGQPVPAIVKVIALAVAPAAIEMLLTKLTGAWYFGWAAALIMYYVMLGQFFELDGGETLLVAAIIYVIGMGAQLIIGILLIQMGISAPGGTGNGGARSLDSKTQQQIELADEEDDRSRGLPLPRIEGREYLKGEKNGLRGLKREELEKIIGDFYASGAVSVVIAAAEYKGEAREGTWLTIEIPTQPKQVRDALFNYHRSLLKKYNARGRTDDIGQHYLRMTIDPMKQDEDDPDTDQ